MSGWDKFRRYPTLQLLRYYFTVKYFHIYKKYRQRRDTDTIIDGG